MQMHLIQMSGFESEIMSSSYRVLASEDLDFDDPPPFLKSQIEQIFWCLSARVRELIKEKYPRRVFFCFYGGLCTWACEDNPALAKERIQ